MEFYFINKLEHMNILLLLLTLTYVIKIQQLLIKTS